MRYLMAYILMALMMLMMRHVGDFDAFSQDIPNISLFPSMMVNLMTRNGISYVRPIFDIYSFTGSMSYRSQLKFMIE